MLREKIGHILVTKGDLKNALKAYKKTMENKKDDFEISQKIEEIEK